jgi:competence protein ComEC
MNRWPLHKANFWETIPFFRLLTPVVVAIVCYERHWLPGLYIAAAISIALIALLAIILLLLLRPVQQIAGIISFICINVLLFCISWTLCYQQDVKNNPLWFGHQTKADAYTIRVTEPPAEKDKTWKLNVQLIDAIENGHTAPLRGEAFIYVYKDNQELGINKGDTLIVPNKWTPIKNAGNPFEFDYALFCVRSNLYYQEFLPANKIDHYANGNYTDLGIIERAHSWAMQQLDHYIQDSTTKGLIKAMLLGDEVNLDNNLLQAYSETGIVHIIAISGGNVTIFFVVISTLLWWLRDKKYLWVKYMVALPLVWFYVLMAGAPPSAIRAAAMFTILAVGFALQKNNNSLNTLFATATILLLAQPMWLFSVGFQLSFVAVLSILIFYKPIYRLYTPVHIVTRALWSTIVASMAAEILVAPLVIYYFHLFPLLFLIANVIAYLFMGIVLILGMLIVACSSIPIVAGFFAQVTIYLVTYFDRIVYWLQQFNPTSFHYLRLSATELILLYVVITGIATFLLQKKKSSLFVSLGTTCVLLLLFCNDEWTSLHQQRLVVYNAPKGNYIELIHGKAHSIIYADSIPDNKKTYFLKPAHTYWQAWQGGSSDSLQDIIRIGDKTTLLLRQPISSAQSFRVDYLIICFKETTADVAPLQQIFHPQMTILGNNYSRKQLEQLIATYREQNMPLHVVAEQGAFVLDAHKIQ